MTTNFEAKDIIRSKGLCGYITENRICILDQNHDNSIHEVAQSITVKRLVRFTYFKPNGKLYSVGKYNTFKDYMFDVFKEVANMRLEAKLPGLVEGHSNFIVLVECPDHPNNHPHLVGTYEGQSEE